MPLRLITAGESHGPRLTAILEGIPAGLRIDPDFVDRDLTRRQHGYGRGGRMKIESDRALFEGGVRGPGRGGGGLQAPSSRVRDRGSKRGAVAGFGDRRELSPLLHVARERPRGLAATGDRRDDREEDGRGGRFR